MKNYSPKKKSCFLSGFNLGIHRIFILCFFVAFLLNENKIIAQVSSSFKYNETPYHLTDDNWYTFNVTDNSLELTDKTFTKDDHENRIRVFNPLGDYDCDGVINAHDLCHGGDDNIDNNSDGTPDCASFPGIEYIDESWICSDNGTLKILVCHIPPGNPQNAQTICLPVSALETHHDHHDDYLGACNVINCSDDLQGLQNRTNHESQNNRIVTKTIDIAMFPNPARDIVRIRLHNVVKQTSEVTIYSKLGQILYQNQTDVPELVVPLSDSRFTTGIYMVRINTNNQIITKQLAITK